MDVDWHVCIDTNVSTVGTSFAYEYILLLFIIYDIWYMYIFKKRHSYTWNISAHQRSHSFYSTAVVVKIRPSLARKCAGRWSRESWSILRNLIFSSLFSTKIWHVSAFQAFPCWTSWKVWLIWECCDGLTPMSAEGWDAHVMPTSIFV